MEALCNSKGSLRWGRLPSGRRELNMGAGRVRAVTTLKAASTATLERPVDEGISRRSSLATLSRDDAAARAAEQRNAEAGAISSGLDFIDLVSLDDYTVWNRLQDAVTYRGLVGCASKPPATTPHAGAFNLKQLKSYRDNVTRNLAPTVARGFANAARAAGHVIAAPAAQPKPASAPPVPKPQPAPALVAVSGAPAVASGAAGSGRASAAQHQSPPRRENPSRAGAGVTFSSAVPYSTRQRVSVASPASQSAAVAAEVQLAVAPAGPARVRAEWDGSRIAEWDGARMATVASSQTEVTAAASTTADGGMSSFEDASSQGRGRRGLRGAGRSLLVGAGRQPGGASAAWI